MTPSLTVYTYKDGLLSRLAHDLKLHVGAWQIRLDQGHITATIDPRSLRVAGVMRDGTLDTDGLSGTDRQKVERTITDEILNSDRYPAVAFEGQVTGGTAGRFEVRGTLELHGRTQPVNAQATLTTTAIRCELELTPSQWAIAPFKAMAGALKVQDRVRVVLELPTDTSALNQDNWPRASMVWTAA